LQNVIILDERAKHDMIKVAGMGWKKI